MQSFIFNDAITFKLATQQEDTSAKVQVFLGVILRWLYSIAVDVIKTGVLAPVRAASLTQNASQKQ